MIYLSPYGITVSLGTGSPDEARMEESAECVRSRHRPNAEQFVQRDTNGQKRLVVSELCKFPRYGLTYRIPSRNIKVTELRRKAREAACVSENLCDATGTQMMETW